MIGRTLRLVLALLVFGSGLMALPALAAKNPCSPLRGGTKGCRDNIKVCVQRDCVDLKGKAKRTCKKQCKTDVRAECASDDTHTRCTPASPSGAFVE